MKIKKLLPLVLLAVTTVLMLSSCDAMLDAIFPTNQIRVDVAVNKNAVTTPPGVFYTDWSNAYYFSINPSKVTLTLTDVTAGTSTSQESGWSSADGTYVDYFFTFLNLKDHVYTLKAYYNSYTAGLTYGPVIAFTDGSVSMTAVQMPYRTGNDSTGHSAEFQMYFYY